jgi:O-antigen ligase
VSSHAEPRSAPFDPVVTLPPARLAGVLPYFLGAGLAAVALIAKGGTQLGPTTATEIAVILVGAALAICALLFAPTPQRRWGGVTLILLAALAGWMALSIRWSIQPADSWVEVNRTVAYVAAFAGAVGIARLAPERGRAILTAVLVACLTVCVIALVEKAFPAATNSTAELARLREPLEYWNALGLIAAMAVPALLWLGARREGPPGVRVLAYPLLGLALVTVLFAYSRGALAAMLLGVAFWFAVVPLRLRGLVVLATAAVPTAAVTAWAFANDALSKDGQTLSARVAAGNKLALCLAAMLILLVVAGVLIGRVSDRGPVPSKLRRGAAIGVLALLALLPLAGAGALAMSERGLTGSVSHAWSSFFGSSAGVLTYGPERLTGTGSKRGAYWGEAYRIWERTPVEGAGAGAYATARKRYRKETIDVRHAHGYVPQTAADLGAVGIALSLACLIAWGGAAWRATRRPSVGPEGEAATREPGNQSGLVERARSLFARAGMPGEVAGPVEAARLELLTLVAVVVTFGVHSAIDWTWAFPGTGLLAVVCAAYVAGHGPPGGLAARRSAPFQTRMAAAAVAAIVALVAAFTVWQPARAESASESSQALLTSNHVADARVLAQSAVNRNPVGIDPLFQWAIVEERARRLAVAEQILERAVRTQKLNPEPWRALGEFQLTALNNPSKAFLALRAARYLDPQNPALANVYAQAYSQLPRQAGGTPAKRASNPATRRPASRPAAGEVATCRRRVPKLQAQLRSGEAGPKAAKKRARLARCQALLRRAG